MEPTKTEQEASLLNDFRHLSLLILLSGDGDRDHCLGTKSTVPFIFQLDFLPFYTVTCNDRFSKRISMPDVEDAFGGAAVLDSTVQRRSNVTQQTTT
eukprot:scaffold12818_cov73-Cylindrotheca_fusiformis.AAC.1